MLPKLTFLLTILLAAAALAAAAAPAPAGVPGEFPKDIPIYKGAKVTKWDTAGPIRVLFLEAADGKEAVVAFYRKELAAKGWKIEKAFSGSPDAFQAALGKRMISFGTLRQGARTVIQIGLMPETK